MRHVWRVSGSWVNLSFGCMYNMAEYLQWQLNRSRSNLLAFNANSIHANPTHPRRSETLSACRTPFHVTFAPALKPCYFWENSPYQLNLSRFVWCSLLVRERRRLLTREEILLIGKDFHLKWFQKRSVRSSRIKVYTGILWWLIKSWYVISYSH